MNELNRSPSLAKLVCHPSALLAAGAAFAALSLAENVSSSSSSIFVFWDIRWSECAFVLSFSQRIHFRSQLNGIFCTCPVT